MCPAVQDVQDMHQVPVRHCLLSLPRSAGLWGRDSYLPDSLRKDPQLRNPSVRRHSSSWQLRQVSRHCPRTSQLQLREDSHSTSVCLWNPPSCLSRDLQQATPLWTSRP